MKRRSVAIDLAPETDLDALAAQAYAIAEEVRDVSPVRVRAHLQDLCEQHPLKAAQLLMVLAIWFDPETTTDVLWERVNEVARSRVTTKAVA